MSCRLNSNLLRKDQNNYQLMVCKMYKKGTQKSIASAPNREHSPDPICLPLKRNSRGWNTWGLLTTNGKSYLPSYLPLKESKLREYLALDN